MAEHIKGGTAAAARAAVDFVNLAEQSAAFATCDFDLRSGRGVWSPALFDLLGYRHDPNGEASLDMWFSRVHREDVHGVRRAFETARDTRSAFSAEHRIVRADTGGVRWLIASGSFFYNEQAEAVRFGGILTDHTARKQAELTAARQARLLELSNDAILVRGADDRITYWNKAAEQIYGYTRDEALGQISHELLRSEFPEPLERLREIAHRTGRWEGELVQTRKDGMRIRVLSRWAPGPGSEGEPDGILETASDITARKCAEDSTRRSAEREQILADALAYLLSADDPDRIIRELFPRIAAYLNIDTYFNYMVNERGDGLYLHSCAGIPDETARQIRTLQFGEAICGVVAQTRRPAVATDIQNSSYEPAALVRSFGIQAYACNPLMVGGRLLGTLSFASRTRPHFCEDELDFLRVITNYAALALDRAQQSMRQSTTRFRQLADTMPQLVWTARADGYLDYYNERWYEFTGFERGQFGDMSWEPLLHPDDVKRCYETWYGSVNSGRPYEIEYRFWDRHENRWRWFMGRALPVRDSAGNIVKWFGTCTDIDGQKRAEEALRTRTEELETLLDLVPIPVMIAKDPECRQIHGNRAASELHRTTPATNLSQSSAPEQAPYIAHLRAGRELKPQELPMQRAAATGEIQIEPELELVMPDGRRVVLSGGAVPLRDASGNVRAVIGAMMDITERKKTEAQLQRLSRQLLAALNGARMMAWEWDLNTGITQRFGPVREVTGLDAASSTEAFYARVHPDDQPHVRDATERAIHGGKPYDIQFRFFKPDGPMVWLRDVGEPHRDESGVVSSLSGMCLDITPQKQIEENLRRANQELEQFAYSASHDLQEPLRNIAIFSQLLQRRYTGTLDQQGELFLGYVMEGAQRMLQLLSGLLAYTQAVAPDEQTPAPVDSGAVLDAVLANFKQTIEESGAIISRGPLPVLEIGKVHLEQILQNLIGNALKYRSDSQPPCVEVFAARHNGEWLFSVRDNGIGIDPAYHERIFGLFKRLHPREGKYAGTGIGLAICEKIVHMYGGRIWVESTLGEGATFHFTVPVRTG